MRCSILIMLFCFSFAFTVQAKEDTSLLFIYSNSTISTELLYTTMSSFYDNVERVHINEVEPFHFDNVEQVVIYGEEMTDIQELSTFDGEIVAIGEVVKELSSFHHFQVGEDVTIEKIDEYMLKTSLTVNQANTRVEAMLYGESINGNVPLVVKDGKKSWINFQTMDDVTLPYASVYLPKVLNLKLPSTHSTMIFIQDVMPDTNASVLEEIGSYLQGRNIPLYLQVTPLYTNLQTNETTYLEENRPLLEVLRQLVENGAFIVAGNYRQVVSENGTVLSDFWNTEADEPLYVDKAAEANAIQGQMTRTIHGLTKLGLAPTALAIPNYMTSLNGYKVSTYHYNIHVGGIQQVAPLFITKPDLLYGGTLLPITLGLYKHEQQLEFKQNVAQLSMIPGAVISASYSVFEGAENFPAFVNLFLTLEDKQWVDLGTYSYEVQTNKVSITNREGERKVKNALTIVDQWRVMLDEKPIEFILWIIIIVTTFFVLLFTIYIIVMRVRYRKRLFEERDEW